MLSNQVSVVMRDVSYAGLSKRETLNLPDTPPHVAAIVVWEDLRIVIIFCYLEFKIQNGTFKIPTLLFITA